jgi:phage shock protein PspC (stress-responsive transcriptional regulator)
MTNTPLTVLRRQPAGRASFSGLSAGIGQAFHVAPNIVRVVWLTLYAVTSGVPAAIASSVHTDGPIGWVYLFWLLTGGSPVVAFYMVAWAFVPDTDGQRNTRPFLLWVLLFLVPLALMGILALASSTTP